jgi:hypothetical protein
MHLRQVHPCQVEEADGRRHPIDSCSLTVSALERVCVLNTLKFEGVGCNRRLFPYSGYG